MARLLLAEPSTAARAELADKLAEEIDGTLSSEAELNIADDMSLHHDIRRQRHQPLMGG